MQGLGFKDSGVLEFTQSEFFLTAFMNILRVFRYHI